MNIQFLNNVLEYFFFTIFIIFNIIFNITFFVYSQDYFSIMYYVLKLIYLNKVILFANIYMLFLLSELNDNVRSFLWQLHVFLNIWLVYDFISHYGHKRQTKLKIFTYMFFIYMFTLGFFSLNLFILFILTLIFLIQIVLVIFILLDSLILGNLYSFRSYLYYIFCLFYIIILTIIVVNIILNTSFFLLYTIYIYI